MRSRSKWLIPTAALSFALAACSPLENANEGKGYAGKADTPLHTTGGGQYSAGNFEAGNRDSWSDALNNRAKAQNEYLRVQAGGAAK